jgi:hypothetical protein
VVKITSREHDDEKKKVLAMNQSSMMEQRLGCEYMSHNSHTSAILVPNTSLQDKMNVQQQNTTEMFNNTT